MINVSQRLRDVIEQEIVSGRFAPGERLDEVSLATRYTVSRTPVREALQQLATAGLIEVRPRRGAVVTSLGPEKLFEMFEVMGELEAMCGRLAARRISPALREELSAAHVACGAVVDDPDRYYERNEVFHRTIYRASGNVFLAEQAEALQKRLRPYRRLQLHVRHRPGTSYAEHQRIVAAIMEGDGPQAAETLKAHVVVQGERFADLVSSLSQRGAA